MNLAVNAQDAMPKKLKIETGYAVLDDTEFQEFQIFLQADITLTITD